jgi:hypothetical protein
VAFSIINIIHILVLASKAPVCISLILWARGFHALNVGIMSANGLVNLGTILHKSFLQSALVGLGLTFTKLNKKYCLKNHNE